MDDKTWGQILTIVEVLFGQETSIRVDQIRKRARAWDYHECRQDIVEFMESDGTERQLQWDSGDPSVGLQAGYLADDKWDERNGQDN